MINPGSIHTNSCIWANQVVFIDLEIFTHMARHTHTHARTHAHKNKNQLKKKAMNLKKKKEGDLGMKGRG